MSRLLSVLALLLALLVTPTPTPPDKVACVAPDGSVYYVHPWPLLGPPPWPELPCPSDVTPEPTPEPTPYPVRQWIPVMLKG